jgi:hypothetical protein
MINPLVTDAEEDSMESNHEELVDVYLEVRRRYH